MSAETVAFKHENGLARSQTVECGGHAGRACAYHDDIEFVHGFRSFQKESGMA